MADTGAPAAARAGRWRGDWLPALLLASALPLAVYKIGLLAHTVGGAEGRTAVAKTLAKSALFLGWDVAGALLFSMLTLALLVAVPRRGRDRLALSVAALLQAAHGFTAGMSLFVAWTVGAPVTKAIIDLGFLNTDERVGAGAAGVETVAGSVGHLVTPLNLSLLAGSTLLPPLLFWLWRGRWLPARATRRVAGALAGVGMLLTIGLLPHLINGEWFGIRVHTLGLERSPIVTFAASYLRPVVRRWSTPAVLLDDPWCFDFSSIVAPGALPENPLLRADQRGDGAGCRPRRTNLIVVQLESAASRNLAALGDPMPYLRGLSEAPTGVALTAHASNWPQTMKAVFTMVCSEMPFSDYPPITAVNPSIPARCLPDTLKAAGYRTAWYTASDIAYDRQLRFLRHRDLDVIEDMYSVPGADDAWRNSWGVDERVVVDALLAWVDQAPDAPFFAFYGMAAGHHPYVFAGGPPPPEPTVRAEREAYRACMGHVDDMLERLMEGLAARDLGDDTLVAIVSDHGEGFGAHGARTHGNQVYEDAALVPAVLAGPQFATVRGPVRFPTSHLDLAPTLLGLLDVPVPGTMKGRDLTRDNANWLVISGARPPAQQLGVRDGRYKLVATLETGALELFDLDVDPDETRNLVDAHADLARALLERARQWQHHARNLIEGYAAIAARHPERCGAAPAPTPKEAP